VERRKGADYILSPFRLIVNEGNYYLLAYDGKKEKMLTFRVDRMKEVKAYDEPREGERVFAEIDMNTYTQRVFSMFNGEQKRVMIRFTNDRLDTVVDRLGINNGTTYLADDPSHFIAVADIEVSDQFYSWICGFRKKATILSPVEVVDGMKKFLNDISGRYETE
jgi:predicted DNA-binding transcriptional regulator YafY